MTCEELLSAMNEYVDGNLEPGVCDQFQQHLANCNPCQVVVDNIRKTIELYRNGERYPLPPELQSRLMATLAHKWRQRPQRPEA